MCGHTFLLYVHIKAGYAIDGSGSYTRVGVVATEIM